MPLLYDKSHACLFYMPLLYDKSHACLFYMTCRMQCMPLLYDMSHAMHFSSLSLVYHMSHHSCISVAQVTKEVSSWKLEVSSCKPEVWSWKRIAHVQQHVQDKLYPKNEQLHKHSHYRTCVCHDSLLRSRHRPELIPTSHIQHNRN